MITLSEIFYAVGVAGFSALGAACVTGIVTVLIWLANGSRERVIREEEREHSRNLLNDERANSRDSVADQRAYEDRVRVWEADRKEVEAKKATAKNEARILLELCRELLRSGTRRDVVMTPTRTTANGLATSSTIANCYPMPSSASFLLAKSGSSTRRGSS
jgi:hypothetical protein